MESFGEVGIPDYMRLMKDYLDGRIPVHEYKKSYFELNKKRVNIPDEEASRITQQAYGDADDYEPDPSIRLPYVIDESQLKERVAKSLRALELLGYRISPR